MKRIVYILLTILSFAEISIAQDVEDATHLVNISIPEIAIVDIEGPAGNAITLTPSFSGEAGDGLDFDGAIDNSLWLNYTSILPGTVSRRNITVEMSDVTLPRGLKLFLEVTEPTGVGVVGAAINNPLRIITNPRNIIRRIKNCYTNEGIGNGSQLTYSLRFNNNRYDELTEFSSSVLVTYTVIDL